MILHLLYGTQQLQDCLPLLGSHDTLLVMDIDVLERTGESLADLPCEVILLEESGSSSTANIGVGVTDTSGWLELLTRYAHCMSWS